MIEHRLSPDIDVYRKDYWDKKPKWRKKDSESLRREEAKRRAELEQSIREAAAELRVAQLRVAEMRARTKEERITSKDSGMEDISYWAYPG